LTKLAALSQTSTHRNGDKWFAANEVGAVNGVYDGGEQCLGFAKYVFRYLYGVYLPGYTSKRYTLHNDDNITLVDDIIGNSNVTESGLKKLFVQAQPGDVIQISRIAGINSASQHTMIFMSYSDEGVYVYDCNYDNENTVRYNILVTWVNQFINYGGQKGVVEGVSLYRKK
jgi:hypothetical protein